MANVFWVIKNSKRKKVTFVQQIVLHFYYFHVAVSLLGFYGWLICCCFRAVLSGWLRSLLSVSVCQISVGSGVSEAVEVQSCLVSPLSDPHAHSDWSIIRDSCPSDPSFKLSHRDAQESTDGTGQEDDEDDEEDEEDEKTEGKDDRRLSQPLSRWRQMASRPGDKRARRNNKVKRPDRLGARRPEERRRRRREDEHESAHTLQFFLAFLSVSFILQPVFNNSIQFLHCCLRLCASAEGPSGATPRICTDGPQIPALTHTPLLLNR